MTSYVLITPARNEALYIPRVIESIQAQKVLPAKWVIVSDGSTDDTDEIVSVAARCTPFIKLVRAVAGGNRSFGAKALAFNKGLEALGDIEFAYIGNLDADITMEPRYYQRMIEEMSRNPRLGVVSGVVWDKTGSGFKRTISSLNHAVGAVQFWRKQCFDAIGGYRPVTVGGVDSLAELTARMKGWETISIPDLPVYHHKPVDSAIGWTGSRIAYRAGMTEYHIGTYPLFAVLKALRRWKQSPVLFSVFIRLFAYSKLWLAGAPRDASVELVEYLKKEQKSLIKHALMDIRECRRNHNFSH